MSVLKVGAIQPNSGTKVNITGSTLLVTTASGHFSGSYEGDGSRLEGVAGFPFTGSGQIRLGAISTPSHPWSFINFKKGEMFSLPHAIFEIDNFILFKNAIWY